VRSSFYSSIEWISPHKRLIVYLFTGKLYCVTKAILYLIQGPQLCENK